MFKIISSKTELAKGHLQFSKELGKYSTSKMKVYVGYKPQRLYLELNYSDELGIWWTFQKLADKYWNSFGVGEPSVKHNNSITCEVNYPVDGFNTRLAGGIAKNEDGESIIVHSGGIGGGKKGIGKKHFTDNYIGETIEIKSKDNIYEYAPVGSLNSERFAYHVALFVKEVARIKKLSPHEYLPTSAIPIKKLKTSFNSEFYGKKHVTSKHSGVAFCDHGLVVNYYKEILQRKGNHVANDQLRDLYIIKDDLQVDTVFEFKTAIDRQSIYTAIGQLLLNNATLAPKPKYVIVIPFGLDIEIKNIIRSLEIELLEYTWINDVKVKFHGINEKKISETTIYS